MNSLNRMFYYLHHTGYNIPKTSKIKIGFNHLTFVLEGSFKYTANGKEYTVEKNDALLLPVGTYRERLQIKEKVTYVIFNYRSTNVNELKDTVFFKNGVNDQIRKLIAACPCTVFTENQSKDNSHDSRKKQAILQNLFECVLIELFDSLHRQTQNPHIVSAIKYINENITSPLTLDDVCRAIHLSKSYTTRLFKKEMNITVSEFINGQKLDLAKNLLSIDELSLHEISSRLGYENYCYFSKIFKEKFGVSPLKMKKETEKRN
ncbi:MAG: AraC family transcriptional regulator [Clostridia bacterium]|nr:AraC family transcriptional regulator [Clostridia bacterium]